MSATYAQEIGRMPAEPHGAALTGATVLDAERLVQVEVADVAAELTRPSQTHEGVEVRTVDVDLAARLVHQVADLAHVLLVDAVRGGVGDHDRRDARAV